MVDFLLAKAEQLVGVNRHFVRTQRGQRTFHIVSGHSEAGRGSLISASNMKNFYLDSETDQCTRANSQAVSPFRDCARGFKCNKKDLIALIDSLKTSMLLSLAGNSSRQIEQPTQGSANG